MLAVTVSARNRTRVPRTPSEMRRQPMRQRRSSPRSRGVGAVESSFLNKTVAHRSLPGLRRADGTHRVPSNGFPCPREITKTDLTGWSVGCTTRSTSPLSTHFRRRHQRVRLFTLLPSTAVLVGEPDFRPLPEQGSIPNPPYRPQRSSNGGGSRPRSRWAAS
jgi:hypothetical protein